MSAPGDNPNVCLGGNPFITDLVDTVTDGGITPGGITASDPTYNDIQYGAVTPTGGADDPPLLSNTVTKFLFSSGTMRSGLPSQLRSANATMFGWNCESMQFV